jgi:O-antigen/teichoic acid export membrane protein
MTARDGEFTLAHGSTFASAVLLIMLSEQTFLNGGPLLVRAAQGAAAAGYIFNVLMVARAPLLLFQGIATSLLPHLTRLRSRGGTEGDAAFRMSIRGTLTAIAAFALFVLVVVAAIGPHLMQIAFGDKFTYDRLGLILVSIGMGLYLSAATLNQAALAQGQARRAAACWVGCAVAFLIWNLLPVLDEFRRVEIGFAGAAAALAGLLYLLYRNPVARPGDEIVPGSPAEIEATLAAAEEA